MTDLVERLRDADRGSQQRVFGSRIFGEAADEIERSEKHRNDLADKIVSQSVEIGALKAEIERLRTALESIADHNKVRDWTATSDNPETHWVTRDGFYAVIARNALKEHPRNAD
jgi:chromosome segregation ATPase